MRSISADVIRIIAVLLVILFHLNIIHFGWIGVELFLFLSGYFAKVSLDKYGPAEFLYSRAKRISPPFICTLTLILFFSYLLLPILFLQENLFYFVAPIFHVFNILLFLKEVDYFNSINWALPTFHFWSLSFEIQIYILIAIFYSLMPKHINWRTNKIFLVYVLLFFLYYRDVTIYTDYFNPFIRIFMFLVGYYYARLKRSVVLFAITCYSLLLGEAIYFVILLLVFTLNIEFAEVSNKKLKAFVGRVAHYSYEIYLAHWPIICFVAWYR